MGGNFPGGSFPDTGFFYVTCFAKIFRLLFFSLKHDILIRKHTLSEMLYFSNVQIITKVWFDTEVNRE